MIGRYLPQIISRDGDKLILSAELEKIENSV